MKTPAELFEAANRAAADAIRWAREPGGERLAALRRQDARGLRALARFYLKPCWGPPCAQPL